MDGSQQFLKCSQCFSFDSKWYAYGTFTKDMPNPCFIGITHQTNYRRPAFAGVHSHRKTSSPRKLVLDDPTSLLSRRILQKMADLSTVDFELVKIAKRKLFRRRSLLLLLRELFQELPTLTGHEPCAKFRKPFVLLRDRFGVPQPMELRSNALPRCLFPQTCNTELFRERFDSSTSQSILEG